MSRAYRVRVKESLVHHTKVTDGIRASLHLLPILPRERMATLLGANLAEEGFEIDGNQATLTQGRILVVVDLEEGTVTVTGEATEATKLTAELTSRVVEEQATTKRRQLKSDAQRGLREQAEALDESQRQALTEELEEVLADIRPLVDRAVNNTLQGALQERAAELGEIQEVSEDPESGAMTIRVKV